MVLITDIVQGFQEFGDGRCKKVVINDDLNISLIYSDTLAWESDKNLYRYDISFEKDKYKLSEMVKATNIISVAYLRKAEIRELLETGRVVKATGSYADGRNFEAVVKRQFRFQENGTYVFTSEFAGTQCSFKQVCTKEKTHD